MSNDPQRFQGGLPVDRSYGAAGSPTPLGSNIADGQRPDRTAIRHTTEEENHEGAGPVERSPSCGELVQMPSLVCRVQEAWEELVSQHRLPRPLDSDGPLRLDLKEEHRVRYEEVRARKIRKKQEKSGEQQSSCVVDGTMSAEDSQRTLAPSRRHLRSAT